LSCPRLRHILGIWMKVAVVVSSDVNIRLLLHAFYLLQMLHHVRKRDICLTKMGTFNPIMEPLAWLYTKSWHTFHISSTSMPTSRSRSCVSLRSSAAFVFQERDLKWIPRPSTRRNHHPLSFTQSSHPFHITTCIAPPLSSLEVFPKEAGRLGHSYNSPKPKTWKSGFLHFLTAKRADRK